MCTCHFCNTEKGGVTPISGEGVIVTGSHYFFLERTLSKPTFSISWSERSTHSFTPEMGFDSIQKSQKLRPEVTNWAFPAWGVMWAEIK